MANEPRYDDGFFVRCRLVQQDAWVQQRAREGDVEQGQPGGGRDDFGANGKGGRFWYAVSLVLEQLGGILQGYEARRAEQLQQLQGGAAAAAGESAGPSPPLLDFLQWEDLLLINAMGACGDSCAWVLLSRRGGDREGGEPDTVSLSSAPLLALALSPEHSSPCPCLPFPS